MDGDFDWPSTSSFGLHTFVTHIGRDDVIEDVKVVIELWSFS